MKIDKNESYPSNWVNLNLMINEETGETHVIGGDRDPGEGDTGYIGIEVLRDKREINLTR